MKLECVPKFCYLGDTLGAGGGVEEVARARVQGVMCYPAEFKELHHTEQRKRYSRLVSREY